MMKKNGIIEIRLQMSQAPFYNSRKHQQCCRVVSCQRVCTGGCIVALVGTVFPGVT